MTPEKRKENIREGIKFTEELMGPDKTIEMAEKLAKAAELGPEAESKAKAAAAFEMMAAFGEAVPFATAAGRAGAVAGRNMREYEKLKRESDAKANQIRLDTARYERAEKRGNIAEAGKYADRIEQNEKDLYALRSAQMSSLADLGIKTDTLTQQATLSREQMAQQLRIAEMQIAAAIKAAVISANRPDINIEALRSEIGGRVADHMRANGGKAPDAMEMAKIRQEAVGVVLPMLRPSYGSVDTGRINSMQSRIKEINDVIEKDNKLRDLPGLGKPMPDAERQALTRERDSLTARMNEMRGLTDGGVGGTGGTGGGTITPPKAAIDMLKQDPSPAKRAQFDQVFGSGAAALILGR